MRIEVRNNDINTALRKLKKKVFSERIIIDYMEHQSFEKPSVKKRRKRAEAIRRTRREQDKRRKQEGY